MKEGLDGSVDEDKNDGEEDVQMFPPFTKPLGSDLLQPDLEHQKI